MGTDMIYIWDSPTDDYFRLSTVLSIRPLFFLFFTTTGQMRVVGPLQKFFLKFFSGYCKDLQETSIDFWAITISLFYGPSSGRKPSWAKNKTK